MDLCDAAGDGRLEDVKEHLWNGVDVNESDQVSNYINLYVSHMFVYYKTCVLDVYNCNGICDWILENRPNCHTKPSYSILFAHLMATLVYYTYTVQLPGLVDWSAFLEQVLLTCKCMTETMGPVGALHGRHGFEIHPSDGEMSLTPFKHVWAYGWHFWDP